MAKDGLIPVRVTPKQDAFCLAYIETGNASEAYRQAYDAGGMKPATVNRQAKAQLDNPKIAARLQELRAPAIAKAGLTLEKHLKSLEELRDAASAAEQYGAAIAAEQARGKASGLYVDKVEHSGSGFEISIGRKVGK